jgi:type IV pilus assembly protein PilB
MGLNKVDSASEQNILNMLMENSIIQTKDVTNINKTSTEIGKSRLETLYELNLSNEEQILKIFSHAYSLPVVDLEDYKIDENIKNIVDLRYIEDNAIVPFQIDKGVLKIAIADASKFGLMKNIKTMTNLEPEVFATSISNINYYINRLTGSNKKAPVSNAKIERIQKKEELIEVGMEVIDFGNKIIADAVQLGASDIHIESFKNSSTVRFRVDGILRVMEKYKNFLHDNYNAVVARFKIISKLDIAERRVPQDGACSFKSDTKEVDLRVSILPTKNNERIVMRILNKEAGDKQLSELGFTAKDLEKLIKAITSPQGMVLVTGPTGSGKTTTLYSVLKHINKPGMNILTAEDPVEYEMEGIGQVQIKESIGYTFEEALRSFLRQDPEVILVGEIRDKATVDIALKASLTGHLVFSTLHTNDAPSSITRLINMGTPNYLIAAALTLIMAQRLARRTCSECRAIDDNITPKLLNSIGFLPEQSSRAKIYKGKGCDACTHTGYKGRMGLYEILEIDREMKAGILSNLQQNELIALAKKNGFRSMQDMGQELLLSGDLSFAEYERVLQSN